MKKIRIAALVGGFYHAAEPMHDALRSSADEESLTLEAFTDPALFPWSSLNGLACIVIAGFVRSGGWLVVLHAGLALYGFFGRQYGATVKGSFQVHPQEHPRFRLRATGASHPALEGFRELELQDEMYFVRVDSSQTTRLLEVFSPDYGSSAAAWAHTFGSGKVFCFTPGHRAEVLSDPAPTVRDTPLSWRERTWRSRDRSPRFPGGNGRRSPLHRIGRPA
jgi:type 1 glutamine amidotransferase